MELDSFVIVVTSFIVVFGCSAAIYAEIRSLNQENEVLKNENEILKNERSMLVERHKKMKSKYSSSMETLFSLRVLVLGSDGKPHPTICSPISPVILGNDEFVNQKLTFKQLRTQALSMLETV